MVNLQDRSKNNQVYKKVFSLLVSGDKSNSLLTGVKSKTKYEILWR